MERTLPRAQLALPIFLDYVGQTYRIEKYVMAERTPEDELWLSEALNIFGAWSGLTLTFMNYDDNTKFWMGSPRWQMRKYPTPKQKILRSPLIFASQTQITGRKETFIFSFFPYLLERVLQTAYV